MKETKYLKKIAIDRKQKDLVINFEIDTPVYFHFGISFINQDLWEKENRNIIYESNSRSAFSLSNNFKFDFYQREIFTIADESSIQDEDIHFARKFFHSSLNSTHFVFEIYSTQKNSDKEKLIFHKAYSDFTFLDVKEIEIDASSISDYSSFTINSGYLMYNRLNRESDEVKT